MSAELEFLEEAEEALEATEFTLLGTEIAETAESDRPPQPLAIIRSFSQEELALPALLTSFRQLLKGDKVVLRHDDEFLTRFLRVKRYDLQRAHTALVHFYKVIRKNQDLLPPHIRPNDYAALYEQGMGAVLRGRGRDGSTVGYFRPGLWDTRRFTLEQVLQASLLLAEHTLQDKGAQLYGLTSILDLQDLSTRHVSQVTPKELKRAIFIFRSELPAKLAGVHILNHPKLFWPLFKVGMRILPKKLRRRVHLHWDLASLHGHFDVTILPKQVGGPLELEDATDHTILQKLLQENRSCADSYT